MISYVDVCDICVDCHIIKRWFNGDDSIIIVSRNQVCAVDMIKIVFTCFPFSHLSTISPQRLKWWITLGTEVTTWTRSAPSQGRSLGWWCEGQLLGSLKKKLWYILSCVIYDILYILYKCHVFYDFVWCILYAFYGIDIWYILWCCMSCIGVFFQWYTTSIKILWYAWYNFRHWYSWLHLMVY